MNYDQARHQIENSSWYRELGERNADATRLIGLGRSQFECELRVIIDRHQRQQVHINHIKQFCRIKA